MAEAPPAPAAADAGARRAASFVAGGIFVSRLIGFVRDRLFAHFFGSSAAADAFNAAVKIPNVLRNLLGEGALSASFIPVYSAALERADEREARALANTVLGILLLVTSGLTVIGIAAAPAITALVATGFDPARAALTTRLVRVLFPMSALMVLSGWCLGIQNSHRRFFNAYASAALWSLAQIVLLVWWGARAGSLERLAWWLAWATLAGSILQILAQLPQVLPLVRPLRPRVSLDVPGVRETLGNFVPVVTALGLFQISSLIDLQIAAWLPTGSVANLGYATRLYMVPIALFGISVAAASLPEFSRESGAAREALLERLRAGWVRILFYIIPTTVAFLLYGDLIIAVLYRSGRFGADEQRLVHLILAAYALGLVGFSSVKLLASAYYALQDYRTPLRAAGVALLCGTLASVGIALPLRHSPVGAAGLAVGASLGAYVNLAILRRGLHRTLGPLYTAAMWQGTWRIVLATGIAAGVALPVRWVLRSANVFVAAVAILPLFGVVYLVSAHLRGSQEATRWLRRLPLGPRR
ncbi:MAG TPA: murein biosynthesis integral membrane protein MurJ [Gemmatimonadaceae bacterium]|nr:murein biosynthesis integral membrane protein MurJ [Gemmatimonadaceae bacterium]